MNSAQLRNAVLGVLDQGVALLSTIDPAHYTERIPSAMNASIGAHIRHCLDHFETLLGGHDASLVDYDARKRDQRIETDPQFALKCTQEMRIAYGKLTDDCFDREVAVRCQVCYDSDESPLVSSTFGREAMYSVVHAIHHYALINVMCEILRIPTPQGFGVAPSTLNHEAAIAVRG